MERVGGAVTVKQRPVSQATQFTCDQPYRQPSTTPKFKEPPCWVNADGLVEVPQDVREELGLRGGGGVFFVKRKDTGHYEFLTDQQLFDLLELRGSGSKNGDGGDDDGDGDEAQ